MNHHFQRYDAWSGLARTCPWHGLGFAMACPGHAQSSWMGVAEISETRIWSNGVQWITNDSQNSIAKGDNNKPKRSGDGTRFDPLSLRQNWLKEKGENWMPHSCLLIGECNSDNLDCTQNDIDDPRFPRNNAPPQPQLGCPLAVPWLS